MPPPILARQATGRMRSNSTAPWPAKPLPSAACNYDITDDLTITGLGADQLTISGNDAVRVFQIGSSTTGTVTAAISGLTIAHGKASNGAGILNFGGQLTVSESILKDNTATTSEGGGIRNIDGGTLVVQASTFDGNHAQNMGGGISNASTGGAVLISDSTFVGNQTDTTVPGNGGGAIYQTSTGGALTLRNSTLSQNFSFTSGGGIRSETGTTLIVVNSTITQNSVSTDGSGGGGLFVLGTETLSNTIVAGNTRQTTPTPTADDIAGTIDTAFNNLIGDAGSSGGISDGTNGNIVGAAVANILDTTLADNGGPTLTHALVTGSPAIDAGNNTEATDAGLTTDQRGTPFVRRFNGTVDIGAYELQPLSLIVDNNGDVSDGNFSTGQLTIREAIELANANPGADEITFGGTLFTDGTTPDVITLGGTELAITDDLTITGLGATLLTISGNNVSRVFNIGSSVVALIDALTIQDGFSAGNGGGIQNLGSLAITNSTVSLNESQALGGGIFNAGELVIRNSTLSENTASAGAAIQNDAAPATLLVENSTIVNNSASDLGGAIRNSSEATIINSTISDNTASTGGAIFADSSNTTRIVNSTITGNSATSAGGALTVTGGVSDLRNTIISGNSAATAEEIRASGGTINADAHNLFGDSSETNLQAFVGFTPGPTDITATSDGMDPTALANILDTTLADNGGPTLTHALVTGSPAIDAGDKALAVDDQSNPLLFDQRGTGFQRIVHGTVDIGAFEVQDLAPTLANIAATVTFLENTVNAAPQIIDSDVTLTDADSPDFDGGNLTVTYTATGLAEDQLSIRNQGTAVGQIGVSGTTVTYGGTAIGTISITSDGQNGADLVVSFNASATVAAVEALIENLTYQDTSDQPTASRTISITVNDGDGGTSAAQMTQINVTPEPDAVTITTGSDANDSNPDAIAVTLETGQIVVRVNGAIVEQGVPPSSARSPLTAPMMMTPLRSTGRPWRPAWMSCSTAAAKRLPKATPSPSAAERSPASTTTRRAMGRGISISPRAAATEPSASRGWNP